MYVATSCSYPVVLFPQYGLYWFTPSPELGTLGLRTQKVLYLEPQIPPAGDQRPWGIHVVAQKQLMVGVG